MKRFSVYRYCKKGIITKLQDLGMEMTEKWFTSSSKQEINKYILT